MSVIYVPFSWNFQNALKEGSIRHSHILPQPNKALMWSLEKNVLPLIVGRDWPACSKSTNTSVLTHTDEALFAALYWSIPYRAPFSTLLNFFQLHFCSDLSNIDPYCRSGENTTWITNAISPSLLHAIHNKNGMNWKIYCCSGNNVSMVHVKKLNVHGNLSRNLWYVLAIEIVYLK